MNKILKEFYGQDASLRSLPADDQQRLFAEWASQNGISAKLEFGSAKWVKFIWFGAVIFAGIYFISFISEMQVLQIAFPISMCFFLAAYTQSRRPILTQTEQDITGISNHSQVGGQNSQDRYVGS